MNKCPTCGQTIPPEETGEQLAERMREGEGHGCYEGADGGFYLEHVKGVKGKVRQEAIADALAKKLIVSKWADAPHLKYWRIANP